MRFGVRKAFIRDEDGDGVIPVCLTANQFKDTYQYCIIEDKRMVGMKYDVPSMERYWNPSQCLNTLGIILFYDLLLFLAT